MKLILLMGKSQSGKDTLAAQLLAHNPHGAQIAFADKLKRVCMDLFNLSYDDCYTETGKNRVLDFPCYKCPMCKSIDATLVASSQVVCKSCTAVGAPDAFASRWTVRMLLQHMGTEGVRRIDSQVWVKHALKSAAAMSASFVIITDGRFTSEADAIWAAGGDVWRIRRPSTDQTFRGIENHTSETEVDTLPDSKFQHVINNNATLAVLQTRGIEALTQALAV
jgi:hypothetical protein